MDGSSAKDYGHPKGRLEDRRLVTGTGCYAADRNFPGQVYAAFLRSDRPHARILNIDSAAAQKAPGVLLVLTSEDVKAAGWGSMPVMSVPPGKEGQALKHPFRPVFAMDRTRYVGECVACVVAQTQAQAMDAVELIKVDYEDLPAVISSTDALKPGAPQLHDDIPGNLAWDWEVGSREPTEAAFREAKHVVKVTVDNTRLTAHPMEPRACVATFDEASGVHTIYCPSQGVVSQRSNLKRVTNLPLDKLEIVAGDVGGSFGSRSNLYPEYCAALLAAIRLKRPVKWLGTRSEVFLTDNHSRDIQATGELALDGEGRFLAMRFFFLSNLGAYAGLTGARMATYSTTNCLTGVYDLPAVYGETRMAYTNTCQTGSYRGSGRPVMSYILERLVDQAAFELKLDPVELRRKNLVPRHKFPYTTAHGARYDSGDFPGILEKTLQLVDWQGYEARRKASAARGKLRGRGIATFIEATGGGTPTQVKVEFEADGGIAVTTAAQSQGQGHETSFAQVLSTELGIGMDNIRVRSGEAGNHLTGANAGGSTTMLMIGSILKIAAATIIEKGLRLAAESLEASAADVEFVDGEYRIKGTDRRVKMSELIRKHAGTRPNPLSTLSEGKFRLTYPNGCHVAEIEIDPDTGETELLSYVCVDDVGNVINHQLVEGQMHGGVSQGLGQVFGEQLIYDRESGQLLTGSFMDYPMPRSDHWPMPELHDYPVPATTNLLGAKGVGEAGYAGAVPVMLNAIIDALRPVGVTHFDMPASPQRIWRAIRAGKAGHARAVSISTPEGLAAQAAVRP